MIEHYPQLDSLIRLALEEDIGPGDVTTDAVVAPAAEGRAQLVARERMVPAGLAVFERTFTLLCPDMRFETDCEDGELVEPEARIGTVAGPLWAILQGERTALNFMQRMSGIATLTRRYVDRVRPYKARILDTRKTTPGHRWLEKYAVRVGGGVNHRFALFDGILIKDNHIRAAGSISKAVKLSRRGAAHLLRVEVEVEDLAGVEEALRAGTDIIMLDNMPPEDLRAAVRLVKGRALLEASGGIKLDTIEEVARTGVDFISVGALTHSARAVDLSLEIEADTERGGV
jgi:nicotinate-nucleotide pyrophosphorylase (carboxylating)